MDWYALLHRIPEPIRGHARSRRWLALGVAAAALGSRCTTPAPPPRTVEGIAAMLGRAVGGEVSPDDFIWEEREGLFTETALGRSVVFRAGLLGEGGTRLPGDVYRARVRLTRSGRPLSVRSIKNLTRTPLGDDGDLVARGRHVAFATRAFGAVQGVTVLDLAGDYPAREARAPLERARAAVEAWLETGSRRGALRTEVSFAAPPADVKLELVDGALVMAVGAEGEPAAVDLTNGALNPGPKNPYGAEAQVLPHPVTPVPLFLVRAASETLGRGPGDLVAAGLARTHDAAARARQASRPRGHAGATAGSSAGGPADGATSVDWPPRPLAGPIAPPLPNEGAWAAPAVAFLPPRPGVIGEAQAYFYETSIRPDADAPAALVRLVVMDTRQVELRLQAGVLAPAPAAGPHGSGRIRARRDELVVAAFNGAADEGAAGAVVERRVVAPPREGAPTLALLRGGVAAVGPWSGALDPLLAAPPAAPAPQEPARVPGADPGAEPTRLVVSLLQAAARAKNDHLADRSALCVTAGGYLLYAWGDDVREATLTRALELGGCAARAAMRLAQSPAPTGFAYLGAAAGDDGPPSQLADPAMTFTPARLWTGATHDFVYVVLRHPRPLASLGEGAEWAPDGGAQPTPAWLPGVHQATTSELGAQVRLSAFSPGRFAWKMRAGLKEQNHRNGGAFPTTLPADERAKVLAAVGLGAGRRRNPRGLAMDGSVGLNFRGEAGVLVVDRDGGRIAIGRSGEWAAPPRGDVTELPLTADAGQLLPEGREVGSMRQRAAACVLEDGTFLVATTTFDSDEATTEALLDVGCARVVALDRGGHQSAFVHRAGSATPPVERYDATALFAVDSSMRGRAIPLTP